VTRIRGCLVVSVFCLACICSVMTSISQGQSKALPGKASISGQVTDENGTIIAGAAVVLTGQVGFKQETKSDEKGEYAFKRLHSGTYTLIVTQPNLPTLKLENITLTPGQELDLDAMLQGQVPKSAVTAEAAGASPAGVSPAAANTMPTAASAPQAAAAGAQVAMPQLPPSGRSTQTLAAKSGSNGGSVTGIATDQTGAVISGARVVLIDAAGQSRETQTDEKGAYSFTGVPPGTYTLSVTAPNFAEQIFQNIVLTGGQATPLDVMLQPAKSTEQVNVVGNATGQVEVENATVSGTITEKEVVNIGLNGRNFTQLVALAPGVSNQTGQDEAKVGVQGSVKYSVNGGRVEYNTFEVDGSDVLNTGLNGASSTLMVYPSLDAIQEVKVLTSNYGAQYGRTASGTVQVTTKSGGQALHGNIYEFIRNEAFNSRNYFDVIGASPAPNQAPSNAVIGRKPLYRRQDFGGTIGGPITIPHMYNTSRQKTFFFFSEEFRLEKTPIDYNQAVPSLKERGLIMTPNGVRQNIVTDAFGNKYQDFDFSDVCPLLGTPDSNDFSRQKFPDCPSVLPGPNGGLAPVYQLNAPGQFGVDKNAATILNSNLIPLPNAASGCNFQLPNAAQLDPTSPNHCYDAAVSPSTYWREELFRIDQVLGSSLKASFRYIHDSWDTTVLAPQWSILRTTNPFAATFPTVQNRFVGPGTSLIARLTDTITPTLLNDLVLSYSNSIITLVDENGPGGAVFQRNPNLDQPLVPDSSAQGQCNPALSIDPITGITQCAIGHIFNNGFGGKMPTVEILGTNAAYGGRGFATDAGYMPWGHTNPTYSVRDDILKSLGHHTLQFGSQFVYSQRNQNNNAIGAASGELQGILTFSNLVHSTGNAFADFLLRGAVNGPGSAPLSFIQSFSQDSAQRRYYQRFVIAEPYFQDDWKVNNHLTVNLGLRISLFGTYHENQKNAWNWVPSRFDSTRFAVDPLTGVLLDKSKSSSVVSFNPTTFQLDPGIISSLGLVQCGVGGTPAGCMSGHVFNPAPRVGFAWDPKGDGKTSIRGGYGVFFEHGTGNEANTGSLEGSAPVVLSMTQPLPYSYPCIGNVGLGPSFDSNGTQCALQPSHPAPPGSVYPLNVTGIPTKAIWPYAQQWSFGVQREVLKDLVGTLAYVGSKGTNLTVERNLNQLHELPLSENPFGPNEPLTIADCTISPTGGRGPGDGTTPFLLGSGTIITPSSPAYVHLQAACNSPGIPNVNSLPGHAYPGLGQVLSLENVANSSYHALQMTLRRTSGPLTLGVSYSYSHSIDNSSDRSDPVLVDSFNLAGNRASSNFDQRHLANVSFVYNLSNLSKWIQTLTSGNAGDAVGDGQSVTPAESSSHFVQMLTSNWQISGVTLYASGTPFTVINSAGNTGISLTDNAGVASGYGIAASYPDVIHTSLRSTNNSQSFGPLLDNPMQFVAPRGLTFGDAGRNFLNNPGRLNFDIALLRHFRPTESSDMEFRVEAFNVFNHTQFRIYDPDNPGGTGNNVISCYGGPQYSAGFQAAGGVDCVAGASFLHPLNAHRPRTIQVGLKWGF
jgi:Carboxypeptidase regulatory-like domain